jgi:hypothetical protein
MAFIPHTKQASRDVRRRLVIVSLSTFCRRGWFPEPGFCVGCPAVLGGEGFFDARNGRAQCGEYLCGLSLYIGSEESESLKITLATCVILPVVWASTAFYLTVNCLGPWRQMAPLLEQKGLPKIDQLMGGRYMPAVHAFFDRQYGLDRGANAPLAPDGVEDFDSWKGRKKNRCS